MGFYQRMGGRISNDFVWLNKDSNGYGHQSEGTFHSLGIGKKPLNEPLRWNGKFRFLPKGVKPLSYKKELAPRSLPSNAPP